MLDEYSLKENDLTGNCFIYNRIEVTRPSTPAPAGYFVFEVPASAYVYSGRNSNARLPASPNASGFIAPAGKTVYFADYVFVGNESGEQRRNLEAARDATKRLLQAILITDSRSQNRLFQAQRRNLGATRSTAVPPRLALESINTSYFPNPLSILARSAPTPAACVSTHSKPAYPKSQSDRTSRSARQPFRL